MFRKKDCILVGGYDESMRKGFEDWEFYIRVLKSNGIAHVLKEPLFNYRKRNNSTTSRANKNKYDLLQYIYTKHKDLYIENYEATISYLLNRTEREEREKIKNKNRIEYKIGFNLLRPIRYIKSLIS